MHVTSEALKWRFENLVAEASKMGVALTKKCDTGVVDMA